MPDDEPASADPSDAARRAVPKAFEANRDRRAQAEAELQAARDEMRNLLVRGQAIGLDVAGMARMSGVSRDTAHRLLREAGSLSRRQRNRLATEIQEAL